jgi:hypothetical protein
MTNKELILKASTLPKRITEEKDFKQVWFTRAEMENLIKLVKEQNNAAVAQ